MFRDRRFWMLYFGLFVLVLALRVKSPPIELPKAAHNTVGDMPLAEQADDGYVSPIEEKPVYVHQAKDKFSQRSGVSAGMITWR